jgi:hypothetical protein
MKKTLFYLAAITLLASCYRMPGDEDCSLIPTTNNPRVTCEKNSQNFIPSCKY